MEPDISAPRRVLTKMIVKLESTKRLRSPFAPPVCLSQGWRRTPKGSVYGKLRTPIGVYSMCLFKIDGGWNTVVSGPKGYEEFAIGFGETPLTYEEGKAELINFCKSMTRHFAEVQTYAAAA